MLPEFTLVSCPMISIADVKAGEWPLKVTDAVTGEVSQVGDREIEALQLFVDLVRENEANT